MKSRWMVNQVAGSTGIEPAVSSVTGWHVNRYTTTPRHAYLSRWLEEAQTMWFATLKIDKEPMSMVQMGQEKEKEKGPPLQAVL
jgi:hypothetical protein